MNLWAIHLCTRHIQSPPEPTLFGRLEFFTMKIRRFRRFVSSLVFVDSRSSVGCAGSAHVRCESKKKPEQLIFQSENIERKEVEPVLLRSEIITCSLRGDLSRLVSSLLTALLSLLSLSSVLSCLSSLLSLLTLCPFPCSPLLFLTLLPACLSSPLSPPSSLLFQRWT